MRAVRGLRREWVEEGGSGSGVEKSESCGGSGEEGVTTVVLLA